MSLPTSIQRLHSWRVVLASQSPRRLELLTNLVRTVSTNPLPKFLLQGLKFDVIPSTFEENLDKTLFPTPARALNDMIEEYVVENAKQKALEVFHRLQEPKPDLIIGCDTVVAHNGKILEKPKDENDAFQMLSSLSNSQHQVYSGVALCFPSMVVHTFSESTLVQFLPLDTKTIQDYISTGEPMDKAGSYGLQGTGRAFVSSVDGCPKNVIGFPVDRFCRELEQFIKDSNQDTGISLLTMSMLI